METITHLVEVILFLAIITIIKRSIITFITTEKGLRWQM